MSFARLPVLEEPCTDFGALVRFINGRETVGDIGIRDPDYPCPSYDAKGYNGLGTCHSDGHYECVNCSELSPEAPRFHNDRDGRRDRLLLFWRRPR